MFLDQNTPPESKKNVLESSFSHPDMVLDTRCTSGVPRRPREVSRTFFLGPPSKTTLSHYLTSTMRPSASAALTFKVRAFTPLTGLGEVWRSPFRNKSIPHGTGTYTARATSSRYLNGASVACVGRRRSDAKNVGMADVLVASAQTAGELSLSAEESPPLSTPSPRTAGARSREPQHARWLRIEWCAHLSSARPRHRPAGLTA